MDAQASYMSSATNLSRLTAQRGQYGPQSLSANHGRGRASLPAATPLAFGNQLKPSEGLGACLESSELLHSIQGFPGGLRIHQPHIYWVPVPDLNEAQAEQGVSHMTELSGPSWAVTSLSQNRAEPDHAE